MPMLLEDLFSILFADDTTIMDVGSDLNNLIISFKQKLEPLINWCEMSKLDINWSKTDFMIITGKRIKPPTTIEIGGYKVNVVDKFKLLGVILDNKLNFEASSDWPLSFTKL